MQIPEWLIKLIIVVALPAVGCFGFYSLDYLDEDKSMFLLPVMLSYPVALIGVVGVIRMINSPKKSKVKLSFWILCIIAPLMMQIIIRS